MSMKLFIRVHRRSVATAMLVAASLLGGCVGYGGYAKPADALIKFDADGCPQGVSPVGAAECTSPGNSNKLCVGPDQEVIWQSVDDSGDEMDQKYDIYFDPFKSGSTIVSNANGLAKARIDDSAPAAEYKYSVVGRDCKDKPYDPRIIVSY